MKAAILLYIKCFLVMGVPFALLMTWVNFLGGEGFQWQSALFLMVGFGGLMSLTLVTAHLVMLRLSGIKSFTADSIKVSHQKHISSALNKEELINKLKQDPDFRWRKFIEKENEIIIYTASSFWSWGEKIVIKFDKDVQGLNQYTVTSASPLKATIVDFGRNLKHMTRLEKMLAH